mmetsp:Transcript_34559/g.35229  ORF Transcript_34559/g.35229 Transcript_34559/m.35229 type:complete len:249 (+) Transcript_34559:177-923(+)|eukprot:CAMPEP_0182433860 /NCGR_PEP_ID=MMETSP1167-20130531/66011_1 /TAXON_ID=2988 /ORGANISM="Mallomonas Sp, Strain CCMP3275" /LENGTH=248 /DNA_ID=CAMNT_0024623057 /DNA_START=76 /DNA_END=822 /DNA_ORIENTATION=-
MFRESDYQYPKVHSTYGNKPVPVLQRVSQATKFDSYIEEKSDISSEQEPEVIPTTWDMRYDPDDPRADWAGYVSKSNTEKRHARNHPSQQSSIAVTEDGFVGQTEGSEWHRVNRDAAPTFHRPSNEIIGGIGQNPEEEYVTSYKRQVNGESTSKDQLSKFKQPDKRRQIPNPAEVHNHSGVMMTASPSTSTSTPVQSNKPVVGQYKSFLADIGASLADSVPDAPRRARTDENKVGQAIAGYTGYRGKK